MPTTSAPLTPRQRRLFEELLTRFLAHGFADFTVDAAAKELHCSKTTLYALGATRDEILARVLISFFRQAAARTAAATRTQPTRRAELTAYFRAMSESMAQASPAFVRDLAADPVGMHTYAINTQAATARIQEILAAGTASGEFQGIAPEFVARLIEGEMDRIQRGDYHDILPAQRAYEALGELLLHGILTRP